MRLRAGLRHLSGTEPAVPVFVLGTGRSGTHWLGRSLGAHPEIKASIEGRPQFRLVRKMAMDERLERWLFPILVQVYRLQLLWSAPLLFLDKSHPNLWLAERLLTHFPDARFIGIERNPYATVASMMKHPGVNGWHDQWRNFPVPNRFLGIDRELATRYDDESRAGQCAYRWVAHHQRLRQLRPLLGERLMTIEYERFAEDPQATVELLQAHLGLSVPIPVPKVRSDSLAKWRSQLTEDEIARVRAITGVPVPTS